MLDVDQVRGIVDHGDGCLAYVVSQAYAAGRGVSRSVAPKTTWTEQVISAQLMPPR